MICPVCQKEMIQQDFGGVMVDVCRNGCKGLWFDWSELNKLDHNNQGFGDALKEALNYPRYNDETRGQIQCPKCGILMHSHKFEAEKEINVDECYLCGGFFLDSGELKIIRDNIMNKSEQQAYLNKIINQNPGVINAYRDLKKDEKRVEAASRFTKFLRLSYYATGR